MPNLINKSLFQEMSSLLEGRDSFLLVELQGLEAEEAHELRGKLDEQGVRMKVVKNRIAARALEELGHDRINGEMAGMSALVFGDQEGSAITAAKAIEKQMEGVKKKGDRKVQVRGALLDGEILDRAQVQNLHAMPDKDTIRSMLIGAIQGPMRGLAAVLAAPGSSLARAMQARIDGEGEDT